MSDDDLRAEVARLRAELALFEYNYSAGDYDYFRRALDERDRWRALAEAAHEEMSRSVEADDAS